MKAKAVKIGSKEFWKIADENVNLKKAFDILSVTKLDELENGRHEIDGKDVFMNVVDCDMTPLEKSKFEAHDVYYDIHCPIAQAEGVGVKARSTCKMPVGEFNSEDDYILYDDPIKKVVKVNPGEIIVVGPEVSHAPCIGEGPQHKVIFKVKK